MNRRPDLPAPSLEGPDERAILAEYLEATAGADGVSRVYRRSYRGWRRGYEASAQWHLPARCPRRLRRWLRPTR